MADDYDLCGQEPPTIEQVGWVFRQINVNAKERGSFRNLIYHHMHFGLEAYVPLCLAGGINITNAGDKIQHMLETQEGG